MTPPTVTITIRNADPYRRIGALIQYLVAMDGRGVNMSYRPATVQGAKCRKDWESTSRLDSVPMGGGKA